MAFRAGRRFSIERSGSHAMTLGDPKQYANRASDHEQNFLEANAPNSIRAHDSRKNRANF